MTDATTSAPAPDRSRRIALIAGALILAAAAFWISQLYTTGAARECRTMYAEARTATDSARVDITVPEAGKQLTEPRSCINYKRKHE